MYTLNSEPKALTGDKSEGIKSRGAAEAFIRGFSPVKAEGEEFNVLRGGLQLPNFSENPNNVRKWVGGVNACSDWKCLTLDNFGQIS